MAESSVGKLVRSPVHRSRKSPGPENLGLAAPQQRGLTGGDFIIDSMSASGENEGLLRDLRPIYKKRFCSFDELQAAIRTAGYEMEIPHQTEEHSPNRVSAGILRNGVRIGNIDLDASITFPQPSPSRANPALIDKPKL